LISKLIDRHTPTDACEAIRMCLKWIHLASNRQLAGFYHSYWGLLFW
jgi:hypothetical protein